MRNPLLIYRLWQAVRKQYVHHALYHHAQGTGYTISYVLEAGFIWTLLISRRLSREYETNTHELLAVTPDGPLGAAVIMSSGVMHKLVEVTQYIGLGVWIMRFILVGGWLGTTAALTDNLNGFVALWIGVLLPIVALGLLHLYDLALAPLLGILVASTLPERNATPIFAAMLHLLLLIISLVIVLVGHTIVSSVSPNVPVFLALSVLNLLPLLLFCEGTTRLLWSRLQRVLAVSPADAVAALQKDV